MHRTLISPTRRAPYSIRVAQQLAAGVHDVPDSDILRKSAHQNGVVQGSGLGLGQVGEQRLVAVLEQSRRLLLLPEPPEAVNLSMVQEEERLYTVLSVTF